MCRHSGYGRTETVSAVHRLLRGNKKAVFMPLAESYRAHVESHWSLYPSWVQAKLRALLASLHVT